MPKPSLDTTESFDYVIVGAGSAGCVLAYRLSEDPGTRVLLLEAGPPDDAPEIRIPAAAPTLWSGRYAWDDATVPQRHAGNRRIWFPSGRGLGGSSSINGMVYICGNRLDYDTWRDRYGCTGWGYADLLPYFLRAEDQQRGQSSRHGTGGPLRVEDPRHRHEVLRAWVAAAEAAGFAANDDFNGSTQDGVGFFQLTQRGGERCSAADAYLRPAFGRRNLVVRTGTLVSRVIVESGRAVGVGYRQDGTERQVRAAQEVVLAGGAIHSPTLLLLSGIGPAEALREVGVRPVLDSPRVGAGLQDHPLCAPQWHTPDLPSIAEEATPENIARWQQSRQGPMVSNGPEVGGFIRSGNGIAAPDIQLGAAPGPGPDELASDPGRRGVSLLVVGLDVRSRGRVSLRSADPGTRPAIDPGYLSDDRDLELLVAGVRVQREIAAHQPFAGHTAGEYAPGADVDDDEGLRAWIRGTVTTVFHPTCSCAMGGAPDAVCDPELRVRGIDRLRVVDASVMPVITRGNTNAPTIAIAERAADLIRGDTPLPPAEISEIDAEPDRGSLVDR